MNIFAYFQFDFWTVWGFFAQGVFTFSFVVQWIKSEKAKQSYLPPEFWTLRLIASIMLVIYVIKRHDIVFLIGTVLQILIYIRNLYLIKKHAKNVPIV
jgi:lipid-A-disaccharide synthase-like uncharacterized protein